MKVEMQNDSKVNCKLFWEGDIATGGCVEWFEKGKDEDMEVLRVDC